MASEVSKHLKRAYVLAQMERRPPGYSVDQWALYLMDLDCRVLRERLAGRVHQEREKVGGNVLFGDLAMPAVPVDLPAELVSKGAKLHDQWMHVEVMSICQEALATLGTLSGRSVPLLMEAQQRVDAALAEAWEEKVPYQVRLAMTKDASFEVKLLPFGRQKRG